MKIIKKYVIGEFLKPFLWCLTLFVTLYWIIDLFDNLDEIVKAQVPIYVLCDYYFSLTPFIFVKIIPIIILLATVYTFNTFNKNNEIIAIKAIGVNLWSIIWLFLLFGLVVSAASFLTNELVLPDSYIHALNLKEAQRRHKYYERLEAMDYSE